MVGPSRYVGMVVVPRDVGKEVRRALGLCKIGLQGLLMTKINARA